MSITVPFRTSRQPRPDAAVQAPVDTAPVDTAPVDTAPVDTAPVDTVALGRVQLRSVTGYLLVWTVVLFAVEMLVLWSSHTALLRLGVLDSVSRAVATVLDEPLPDSGVLPALEFTALLPWLLAAAASLAVLWLLTLLAVVLVHNGICAVTGGPRVHVR